jgi:hypothetical protein
MPTTKSPATVPNYGASAPTASTPPQHGWLAGVVPMMTAMQQQRGAMPPQMPAAQPPQAQVPSMRLAQMMRGRY